MEKLFVLAGKARSGKDTTADIIENYYKDKKVIRRMYGRWLKDYAMMISDWSGSDEDKPRSLLQELAVKSREINPGYTIRRMEEDINILKDYFDIIIITDTRMKNEIVMPKKFKEAITIKVERPNYESALTDREKANITETALDSYSDYDYKIINDGTVTELEVKVTKLLKELV